MFTAKAWGNSADKPILVTHGAMDNAGTFDRLIPLLPKSFYYICIDFPSHGRSSHFPPFFPIHTLNFVLVVKLVLDYFNRGKYILLGHSFGAGLGNFFARLYPQYVEKIIGIDIIAYVPVEDLKGHITERFNICEQIHNKQNTQERPTYTKEKVIEKIINGRWGQKITNEAALALVTRILEPAGK